MYVIHIVPAISEEASGPSYSVVRLCESLNAEGQDVTLAALDWAPIVSPPPFLKTFSLGWGPRRLARAPEMYRWMIAQVRRGSVNLLHNHSLWMMPNVYPGQVARRFNVPLIVSPRGTLSGWAFQSGSWGKRLFWPLLQKPSLRATTCFHATTNSEYEDIRRIGFRQPVAVIPNGIDMPAVLPKTVNKYRTLLFLSRIHPIKGLDMLLPAWRAVQARFPEWRLRIVGPDNGGYLGKMKSLAAELGVARVEFVGAVYGQHKWQMYRDADLFILPTYSENFGMAVAEALAAGTPAIVTKGAPWEGLERCGAGWWIEIGIDPLVACFEQALSCFSDTLEQMGRQGRVWMEQDYSWPVIGRKMAQTYQWVLHGGEKPEWVIKN